MTTRIASCCCGSLSIRCVGEPSKVSLCHCRECQKRTGSPFGIAAFFPNESTVPQGASQSYSRPSNSGHTVTFHFCPVCGSTVFWRPQRMPGAVAVAVGAFADPDFPAPTQGVYVETRHPWVSFAP